MLEELPCTRDSRDVLENMLKIIWVVVRRDRRSVQHALPAGVLFSALKRLKDIIHKNSVNEVLSTCAVLLGESGGGTDVETCKSIKAAFRMLEVCSNFLNQVTKFPSCVNFSKGVRLKQCRSLLPAHLQLSTNCQVHSRRGEPS